jgi:hypothetical protein
MVHGPSPGPSSNPRREIPAARCRHFLHLHPHLTCPRLWSADPSSFSFAATTCILYRYRVRGVADEDLLVCSLSFVSSHTPTPCRSDGAMRHRQSGTPPLRADARAISITYSSTVLHALAPRERGHDAAPSQRLSPTSAIFDGISLEAIDDWMNETLEGTHNFGRHVIYSRAASGNKDRRSYSSLTSSSPSFITS